MYLRTLYAHHKGWFFLVVFFMAGQLFINYKRGVVFSPFYHYGMYSAVMLPKKIYIIPEIDVNGVRLADKDFSPQTWDQIELPVTLNDQQQEWNRNLYLKQVQRLLHFRDSALYLNHYSREAFQQWYQHTLSRVLARKVDSVSIRFNILVFSHHQFKPTGP